ncbi:Multidrug resistance protein MdtE precursor [Thalassovita gelatinovora]|uniref:Multidrug resistance protein MdtE n=1 Tax=Thalassovita gelatinovora TaxID=53501 RepID=A0A0P1FGI1_THAGE|nr:HlyD family efflux transporter periplasmic adaptor subunit [Thalassovita gelatinovora]QIZ81866.1 HlyD family efflux transporter periplasmic adaptor subunit [Thalassovita gelatinovora]CUH67192.1 Multidrug resistance protein MdtE precursor [Thalassovita gelatinovora]SEP78877.1 Biotin-lipoyl like [Thalassovita gelatinovora]
MRFLRQSMTGLFLFAITLGLVLFAGSMVRDAIDERLTRDARKPQVRERVFSVAVVIANPQTVAPVLQAFGQIESRRSLQIRSAVPGTVIELAENFEEGGAVTDGQILLRIDPADADAALQRAGADLLDAEAEIRDAERGLQLAQDELTAAREQADLRQRAFERQKGLAERGVVTETAVETAELAASSARQAVVTRRQALAQAEARIDKAKTSLERARIARDEAQRLRNDTEVRAEFSGTLSDVSAVAGGLVGSNEKLADLIDGNALEVVFRVSTSQYARLLDPQGALLPAPVRVTLDVSGIDLSSSGTLSRASAAVGEGQTGRLVFASLDTPRGMKPGDFVTVAVEEPQLQNVVRLPSKALAADSTVLVLGEGDRLETLPVTLLRRQGDDILIRAQGVAGRSVVAERTPLLGAGIKVRPLQPEATNQIAEPEMVDLNPEKRARLVAFVEANKFMPDDVKTRILTALQEPQVPAQMVQRLESRMGG